MILKFNSTKRVFMRNKGVLTCREGWDGEYFVDEMGCFHPEL